MRQTRKSLRGCLYQKPTEEEKMEIKLNDEQRKQLLEDCYIKVVLDDNNWLYAESCDEEWMELPDPYREAVND